MMMPSDLDGESVVKRRDVFRDIALHEIDLLNQRTNMFLVYNSILMAGLAVGSLTEVQRLIITISGFFSAFIWLYLGQRGILLEEYAWQKVRELEKKLEDDQRVHTQFIDERHRTRWRIIGRPSSVYVGRWLPFVWLITWISVYLAGVVR
jgi:hypothetical protein